MQSGVDRLNDLIGEEYRNYGYGNEPMTKAGTITVAIG
jgi:hypothetical protein